MSTARYASRPMVHGQAQPRSSATHNPTSTGPGQSHAPLGPPLATARSTYPKFLSVQETALLHIRWAYRGLLDSFRWDIVARTVARCVTFSFDSLWSLVVTRKLGIFRFLNCSDAEIRVNVYKSLVLNSLSLFSIYVFDLLLQPLVRDQQKWFHRNIGWFYQVLWLLPVVGSSLYLNVRLFFNNPFTPTTYINRALGAPP